MEFEGFSGRFSPFWLRDHCHAKESLNPTPCSARSTRFSILSNRAAKLDSDEANMRIEWNTRRWESGRGLLVENRPDAGDAARRGGCGTEEHGKRLSNHDDAEIMASDRACCAGCRWWRKRVRPGHGTPRRSKRQGMAVRIGYVRETTWRMWIHGQSGFKDTAYTPVGYGPHTDGTYSTIRADIRCFLPDIRRHRGREHFDGIQMADQSGAAIRCFRSADPLKVTAQYLGDGCTDAEHR